jgi:secreted trypsin-like serine protease
MKFLVLALFAVAVAAEIDYSAPEWNIDWSQAVSVEEMPGYWDDKYELPKAVFMHNERSARIVGGVEVVHGEHPYQASILMQFATGSGLCGASLIGVRSILTAAHCPIGSSATTVIMGAHNRVIVEPQQQRQIVPASAYHLHAQYTPSTLANDIAILIAPAAWSITPNIQRAVLPHGNLAETFAGLRGTSTGWGRTTNGGATSNVMRRAVNNIITNAVCAATYGTAVVNAGVICIETNVSLQGTCHGDSGGVLSVNEPQFGGLVQVGVTSFVAAAGCVAGFPSGFERVTFHNQWILDRINL